jgi:DNA-binding response OmpR family regulator
VTAEQIACFQPDLVILDLGADAPNATELLRHLRRTTIASQLPIVVTGRDRNRLEEIVAGLDDAASQPVTVAPFDRDLRELVAVVAALTNTNDAEPAEATSMQPVTA